MSLQLHPYAIQRTANGYLLTYQDRPLSEHRRKRDALSHAVLQIHTPALLR